MSLATIRDFFAKLRDIDPRTEIVVGLVLAVITGILGYMTAGIAGLGLVAAGLTIVVRGLLRLSGFAAFVAMRYLLNDKRVTLAVKIAVGATLAGIIALHLAMGYSLDWYVAHPRAIETWIVVILAGVFQLLLLGGVMRYSRPSLYLWAVGFCLIVLPIISLRLLAANSFPFVDISTWTVEELRIVQLLLGIAMIAGGVLCGLAYFFGTLRAFFTFFTTVPIGGVWIGTAALVMVLSVMSGFENDLRDKILGSNAHIQITKNRGEFTGWEAIKKKVDGVPGVVASTPYATSEVVVAAHNNGMPVIIKGIDPETVGGVTDLVSDLEDKDAMKRLEPLVTSQRDLSVPQTEHAPDAVDPAPPDLPTAGEPIDFSAGGNRGADIDDDSDADADADVLDPAPDDLVIGPDEPQDFSAPAHNIVRQDGDMIRIDVDDYSEPVLPRRVQSLPGMLVGKELVKQTHVYTGAEVHVVSPLSDPSNPDATGTPIPFNRDYRIAGVFFTGMYEYDLKYVYVTLESLQDFLDRGDAIDGIEVRVRDADDTERMVAKLQQALGSEYRIVDWRELNKSLFAALKLEKIVMFLVLGIVILVASFSIVGNLIMVVVEKGRQIALLKTLGASDRGVVLLFAIQGLMIGIIGTALGIITGLAGCLLGKKYGLPLDPNVYYIDRLPIHIDPSSVGAAAVAGVLISILATLYPASLAAKVRPAAGMRH